MAGASRLRRPSPETHQQVLVSTRFPGCDGVVTVESVAAPDVIDAGWDLMVETAKMKQVIEEALAD